MAFADLLRHRVTVLGPSTDSVDAGGGDNPTWGTTRTANVPVLINVASAAEQSLFDRPGITVTHVVATLYTSAVIGDKLYVTSPAIMAGAYLHVEGVRKQPGVGDIDDFCYLHCRQVT